MLHVFAITMPFELTLHIKWLLYINGTYIL